MRKQYLSAVMALCLMLCSCTGKSTETTQNAEETIELIEPEGDSAAIETVQKRDLYQAAMYPAFAVPDTTAYAFDQSVVFDSFGRMPGETVKKGDVLIYADTTAKDEQIEDMEERIAQKDSEYVEYVTEMSKPPKTARTYLENVRWEMELRHYRQLYEVDQALQLNKLELYRRQREELSLKSDTAGEVVSVLLTADSSGRISAPRNMQENQKVIAVGNPDRLVLCCDYIKKGTIAAAKDVFAVIHGKRYEITYQPMDADEYARLTELEADICSTFVLNRNAKEVAAGDYAMITVISDQRQQVLSVPKSAVKKDSEGYFVYRMEEGRRAFTRVEKGISDGVYTEILSGLSEGDQVYVDESFAKPGEQVYTLEPGNYSASYEETGMLGYPNCTEVKNEIKNGSVYFIEYLAEQYDFVHEGDPIAAIRVESDPVEEERLATQLTRITQRYQDLEKSLDLSKEEDVKRLTAELKLYEQAKESYDAFQADKQAVLITAPADGIVVSLEKLDPEKQLYSGQRIAEIADRDRCYILVPNEQRQLQYGNTVSISYQDKNGKTQKTRGTVANISGRGIDSELQSNYAVIAISPEDSLLMAAPPPHASGWQAAFRFQVTAKVRSMDNVLLVPKAGVLDIGGTTYVYVVGEDGSRKLTPFLSGGHDDANYWVVQGLSEGMKICLQ